MFDKIYSDLMVLVKSKDLSKTAMDMSALCRTTRVSSTTDHET